MKLLKLTFSILFFYSSAYCQIKPEFKIKIDSIKKINSLTPQQKRIEIQKIVKLNRTEILEKHRKDFLNNMYACGFTDENEYKKYLDKNSKLKDAEQEGKNNGKENDSKDCNKGKGDNVKRIN